MCLSGIRYVTLRQKKNRSKPSSNACRPIRALAPAELCYLVTKTTQSPCVCRAGEHPSRFQRHYFSRPLHLTSLSFFLPLRPTHVPGIAPPLPPPLPRGPEQLHIPAASKLLSDYFRNFLQSYLSRSKMGFVEDELKQLKDVIGNLDSRIKSLEQRATGSSTPVSTEEIRMLLIGPPGAGQWTFR